jgi:hypothetical protein
VALVNQILELKAKEGDASMRYVLVKVCLWWCSWLNLLLFILDLYPFFYALENIFISIILFISIYFCCLLLRPTCFLYKIWALRKVSLILRLPFSCSMIGTVEVDIGLNCWWWHPNHIWDVNDVPPERVCYCIEFIFHTYRINFAHDCCLCDYLRFYVLICPLSFFHFYSFCDNVFRLIP